MRRKTYNLSEKEIVVGSSLSALAFASKNNLPFVFGKLEKPHHLDRFEANLNFGDLSFYFPDEKLESLFTEKNFGPKKIDFWNWLWFDLGLRGLSLGGEFSNHVLIKDENKTLQVMTSIGKQLEFQYDKLHLFSDKSIRGIPGYCYKTEVIITVYDYFNILANSQVPFDFIETDDRLINMLWFVSDDRHIRKNIKDAIGVSLLEKEELNEFIYGEISARYKVHSILRELKYEKKLKLDHRERIIVENKRSLYYDTESVVFHTESEEALLCLDDHSTSQASSLV